MNGKLARERLSRGEQKILSAALLLSQARLMADSGEKPLLLMDDLASEFDAKHLANVMAQGLALEAQLWVTATTLEPYAALGCDEYALFHVEQGKLLQKQKPESFQKRDYRPLKCYNLHCHLGIQSLHPSR